MTISCVDYYIKSCIFLRFLELSDLFATGIVIQCHYVLMNNFGLTGLF